MFEYGLIESLGHHDGCRCGCRVFVVDGDSSLAKRVTWLASHIVILLILSLTLFAGICTAVIHPDGEGSASVVACSLNCDRYTISPGRANYDEATDSTDFTYMVSVGNGTCGMQNWLLFSGGCLNATDILSANPVPWEFIEIEEESGMQAIKFDTGIESPEAGKPDRSRIYSLKLAGNWSGKTAPVEAAIVTSGGRCLQNVIGTSC